uniref:FIIND domain-containing protein n=1 Tax=Hucho hucho TaxID=62062 RepID=A0A4W5Q5N2_9TELE
MEGEGEVLYRTVPWNRRLLAQSGKRPAGPLFKIDCPLKSVCQLHLPHSEIHGDKGGCDFLSVAHVTDDNIEIIPPHEITETHIIINITGFSDYGLTKDKDAPMSPINGLVLSFFKPSHDLYVLLLPKNVVLEEVEKKWKDRGAVLNLTPPDCELTPNKSYSLSGRPVHLIQPKTATFVHFKEYENYTATFQVKLQAEYVHLTLNKKINAGPLFKLRGLFRNSDCVWERSVEFQATPPRDDSAVSPTEVPSSVTPTGGATVASKLHLPAAPPTDISTHPPQQTSTLPPTSMVIQSLLQLLI